MKITALYVYPIKALRGIELKSAEIGPQGIRHDRRFMLLEVKAASSPPAAGGGGRGGGGGGGGALKKMQLSSYPQCALFEQQFVTGPEGEEESVIVRYHGNNSQQKGSGPSSDVINGKQEEEETLLVPLDPDISSLEPVDIVLHSSRASAAYRMGDPYDSWLSARFGFPTVLVYLGDGRRPVLGKSLLPPPPPPPPNRNGAREREQQQQPRQGGWISSIMSSLLPAGSRAGSADAVGVVENGPPWIGFTDVAPLLVTSESSLRDVNERLLLGECTAVPMYKFRPNIVVDGDGEKPWAEDFWAELTVGATGAGTGTDTETVTGGQEEGGAEQMGEEKKKKKKKKKKKSLVLTGNCARCTSLNVDYETGRRAEGELGNVLKRLMKDRRVDPGTKWSPVFGRYAFLPGPDDEGFTVSVGDGVSVTRRNLERTVMDWPGM
ncbi:hypothetical protein VTK26DRAFT_4453 [Humicola hyalothermophila]